MIIISIFFLFFSFNNNFSINLLSISSSISNIGFSLDIKQNNLSFIFLIFVIIGGSFFSTSSGLRFIKIYSLFKYSLNQILSFSKPKNIFMNKLIFTKINFNFNEINKYFLSVLIFIFSLLLLTSLLSLSGIMFENSFKLSTERKGQGTNLICLYWTNESLHFFQRVHPYRACSLQSKLILIANWAVKREKWDIINQSILLASA